MTERQRIVCALAGGPLTTKEIAKAISARQGNMSARLSEMAAAGIVRRAGARNTGNPRGGRSEVIWTLVRPQVEADAPGLRQTGDALRAQVLAAVAAGAEDAAEVAEASGLDVILVRGAAFDLRGDGERPVYLCCADGMPWALTLPGAALLEVLRG